MSNLDLNSKQWCELVFEGKNHEFGAYKMRQESTDRHNKAMLIVIIALVAVIALPKLIQLVTPKKAEITTIDVPVQLQTLKPPEVKHADQIIQKKAAVPPPLKSTVKFTAPKIVKDEEAVNEDVKSQDELANAKGTISMADVKGNDDINGADIRDVGPIAPGNGEGGGGGVEADPVYDFVEQDPSFPGGNDALRDYLRKNLKYPTIAQENGMQGTVRVQFVVTKSGTISNVKVLKSAGDRSLDEEAVRVIKGMPKWIPGKQNGASVSSKFTLPVVFKMAE